MYRPEFRREHKRRRNRHLFTRYCALRHDKHRIVLRHKSTGDIRTVQYPNLYPLTRSARDFEV